MSAIGMKALLLKAGERITDVLWDATSLDRAITPRRKSIDKAAAMTPVMPPSQHYVAR